MKATRDRSASFRTLWGDYGNFNGRGIDVFVRRLRKYLKAEPRVEAMSLEGNELNLAVR